jgi:hypothetical protein
MMDAKDAVILREAATEYHCEAANSALGRTDHSGVDFEHCEDWRCSRYRAYLAKPVAGADALDTEIPWADAYSRHRYGWPLSAWDDAKRKIVIGQALALLGPKWPKTTRSPDETDI